jgi:serine/threonine protein kinase
MVGKTISHYKITEKLGEGGMGEVYLAEDTKLKRQVAIKFLPEHLTKNKENVERFEREAEAAAALNHPNIVTIYEIAEEDDQTFIVMEYVDGVSLRTKVDDKNVTVEEVLHLIEQICEGLTKAHQADIVHRDIKPENILIDNDGRVKILDFGLAKLKGVSKLTKETSTLGTIHYMSPEQLQGKEVDHRSDIWSLGVVLYEMLTGEVPFKGEYEPAVMYAVLNEVHEPIKGDRTGMSRQLERIINISLEKDRDLRYQNVSELIADLNTEKPEISTQKTTPVIKKKESKFWMLLAGASAIIIVIIFILYLPLFNKPEDVIDSIAVLPFELKFSDPELEYLGDGIARGISNRLSQLPYLDKVISSSTLKNYKGKDVDAKTIAQNVKVKAVVFGDELRFMIWKHFLQN